MGTVEPMELLVVQGGDRRVQVRLTTFSLSVKQRDTPAEVEDTTTPETENVVLTSLGRLLASSVFHGGTLVSATKVWCRKVPPGTRPSTSRVGHTVRPRHILGLNVV